MYNYLYIKKTGQIIGMVANDYNLDTMHSDGDSESSLSIYRTDQIVFPWAAYEYKSGKISINKQKFDEIIKANPDCQYYLDLLDMGKQEDLPLLLFKILKGY